MEQWNAAAPCVGSSLIATVPKILDALLATLSCGFVYLLGRRLFGPSVGLVAAAILALLPGDVFYSALLLSETAFATTFTAALLLLLLVRSSVRLIFFKKRLKGDRGKGC